MTHDDHRYRKKKSWKFILYFFCGRLGTIYSTIDEVNFAKENLLEPTFQERYSQVARLGKHSEYTVIRFIFFGLKLSNVGCQRAGVAQKRANFEQNKILKDETSHGIFRMFPRPCDLRVFLLKCRL